MAIFQWMILTKPQCLIVNTCGFIGPAKEESYRVLGELAKTKHDGQVLIAAGCLTQRYGVEVAQKVHGIDGILGTRRWMDIVQVVKEVRKGPRPEPLYHLPEAPVVGSDEKDALRVSVAGASAYIKVADGCRRPCAFCAIPLIKGTAVSRPLNRSSMKRVNCAMRVCVNWFSLRRIQPITVTTWA